MQCVQPVPHSHEISLAGKRFVILSFAKQHQGNRSRSTDAYNWPDCPCAYTRHAPLVSIFGRSHQIRHRTERTADNHIESRYDHPHPRYWQAYCRLLQCHRRRTAPRLSRPHPRPTRVAISRSNGKPAWKLSRCGRAIPPNDFCHSARLSQA